jgi:hypothetical protein
MLGRHDAVYGLRANGLSIGDYLAVSEMAAPEFSPSAAVLLIVDGDVIESLLRQIGRYNFTVRGMASSCSTGRSAGRSRRRCGVRSVIRRCIDTFN